MSVKHALAAVALLLGAPAAFAQTTDTEPLAEPAPAPAPAAIRIPAGTIVQVELTEALSSETSQQQQLFGLRLAGPIIVEGREVVPAGAIGGGEVIDAHASAFGGRQGRLIISGRFVEINGERARSRGMPITAAGEQRTNTALAVSMIPYAGVAGIFVQGGEIEIPVGARGTARLATDIDIPLEALAAPPSTQIVSTTAEAPTPISSGENQQ